MGTPQRASKRCDPVQRWRTSETALAAGCVPRPVQMSLSPALSVMASATRCGQPSAIPHPRQFRGTAFDGTHLWVTNYNGDSVTELPTG
jgi:hypothetical protein